jgi:predicted DNA-binding protein with PD1-like motif
MIVTFLLWPILVANMQYEAVHATDEYLARLDTGADWREEIEDLARVEDVTAGWFSAMGAVQDAEIWFYDQTTKVYDAVTFDEPLEVASCVGNLSLLDGEHFAHTHAVLSRPDGESLAGHLNAGTVFAGEVYLTAFDAELIREHDDQTELDLWF